MMRSVPHHVRAAMALAHYGVAVATSTTCDGNAAALAVFSGASFEGHVAIRAILGAVASGDRYAAAASSEGDGAAAICAVAGVDVHAATCSTGN